jgi:putative alpha-1,2-mannosidase
MLHLAGGKDFVIEARNLSLENIYVIAATLNGKPIDRAWLRHREIAAGGRLLLTMSNTPAHWAERNLPPSSSDSARSSDERFGDRKRRPQHETGTAGR